MEAIQQQEVYSYNEAGRMNYHPDFHPNQGKPFTAEDLEYLCKYYEVDHIQTMAFALGRTEASLIVKVGTLKRQGLYDYYKNRNKYWI